MTNQIGNSITQAAKRMPGLERSSVLFDDTPYWHTVAWEIIVLVGSCVLLACILRGVFNLKDNPTFRVSPENSNSGAVVRRMS